MPKNQTPAPAGSLLSHINALCALDGVSGGEEDVRTYILTQIAPHCECTVDALGNILAHKKGAKRPKSPLLFSAHMDEVGFIITKIEETGLLRFAPVGGIDSRAVFGRPVRLCKSGLPGVIGGKAVHLLEKEEKEKPVSFDDLYIDIGAPGAKAVANLVAPGDLAAFFPAPAAMADGRFLRQKALDDRAGCALLIDLIASPLPYDCHFAFTVQEETGCTGAKTAAFALGPALAVTVETTTAADIPDTPLGKEVCRLGAGPVLSFMDKGAIYDKGLYESVLEIAKAQNIPHQKKEGVYGGNESRSIQSAGSGARIMAVSLPCRYIHTAQNLLCVADLAPTRALLAAVIESWGQAVPALR